LPTSPETENKTTNSVSCIQSIIDNLRVRYGSVGPENELEGPKISTVNIIIIHVYFGPQSIEK